MPIPILEIEKNWYRGTEVVEPNWDEIKDKIETWAASIRLDVYQIARDIFDDSYDFNNDGNPTAYQGNPRIYGDGNGVCILVNTDTETDRTLYVPDEDGTLATQAYVDTAEVDAKAYVDKLVPIGAQMMFDDYNGTVDLPDSDYWQILDGSTISDVDSPYDGITLKDWSGRYPVGFTTGTVGDGSIGTASTALTGAIAITVGTKNVTGLGTAFDTELKSGDYIRVTEGDNTEIMVVDTITNATTMAVVDNAAHTYTTAGGTKSLVIKGNADHQIDLEHTHDADTLAVASTALSGSITAEAAHTHSVPAHYHGKGTLNITSSGSHSHTIGVDRTNTGSGTAIDGTPYEYDALESTSGTGFHAHTSAYFDGSVGNVGGVDGDSAMTSGAGSSHTHANTLALGSGALSGSTDAQLSATQSIQVESHEVRIYLRYK